MSKARDLANAGTALGAVTATELAYVDGVTSAIQTQLDAKIAKSTATAKGDILVATGSATIVAQPIGTDGQVLTADSTQSDGIKWSTPVSGLTWTNRKVEDGSLLYGVTYNGSNLYIAWGGSGVLFSSPDAITWTSRTSGFGTTTIQRVAYGNGLWVAVGNSGKLTTSTDGITWTTRTANMSTNTINSVIYANSLWVAVGEGGGTGNTGGITYSSDGLTWTRKSQTPAVGSAYTNVIWNGTNWIVSAGSDGTNNYLYATTPSGTWTAAPCYVSEGGIDTIWYDGTRTLAAINNRLYWDTGTTLSNINTSTVANQYYGVVGPSTNAMGFYYSNKFYLTRGLYLNSFTSVSTRGNDRTVPTIMPGTVEDNSNVLSTTIYVNGIYVNSSGIIIANTKGGIWTSF